MPTIEISQKTLERLVGRKVDLDDLECVKGNGLQEGGMLRIEIGDTNRPDLWSVEGVARSLRGYYGLQKGMPKMKVRPSGKKILVNANIRKIRPYIAGFIAKKLKIGEELLLDMIQIQEKVCENYGKKRKKISIGIYNYDMIRFPVHYKAVAPDAMKFTPLEFDKAMTLKQILDEHPKGIQYGYIVKEHKLYPIFIDSKDEVLSFPPIINSNYLGKVEPGTQNIFTEITGSDIKSVMLVTNILAQALHDRGASIESVVVEYPWKTRYGQRFATPAKFGERLSFGKSMIAEVLGIALSDREIKNLLERMQYDAAVTKDGVTVAVPGYRNDIMHAVDVIEDLAIAYGYGNFKESEMTGFTIGKLKEGTLFLRKCKEVVVGLGFQEILSPILTSKPVIHDKMRFTGKELVEIDNVMSDSFSVVRSWVLPSLLACLAKNLHVEYPQKIFEMGEVVTIESRAQDARQSGVGEETKTSNKLAACIADTNVGYEQISSTLDAFLRSLGIKYKLEAAGHGSFIKGRCARIAADGKIIGLVGEIHPEVLNNFGIEMPAAGFELNIDDIFEMVK